MAFWYTCSSNTTVRRSVSVEIPQANVYSVFIPVAFIHYIMLHVCWCVILVVMYMNSIFLSVFSSVSSPSMWVIVPAKPWWSIETFGMLIPPKDDQNGRAALVSLWRTCYMCLLLLCALIISRCFCYPHSLNLDFSYIGLSMLTILILCLIVFPQTVLLSDAQDAQTPPSCNSKCRVCPPPSLLNKAPK